MTLRPVPDLLFSVGAQVQVFPDVKGVVCAVHGDKRQVRASNGVVHVVSVLALVEDASSNAQWGEVGR